MTVDSSTALDRVRRLGQYDQDRGSVMYRRRNTSSAVSDLQVTIEDTDGNPVEAATVELTLKYRTLFNGDTNTDGVIEFEDIPRHQDHHYVVTDNGDETVRTLHLAQSDDAEWNDDDGRYEVTITADATDESRPLDTLNVTTQHQGTSNRAGSQNAADGRQLVVGDTVYVMGYVGDQVPSVYASNADEPGKRWELDVSTSTAHTAPGGPTVIGDPSEDAVGYVALATEAGEASGEIVCFDAADGDGVYWTFNPEELFGEPASFHVAPLVKDGVVYTAANHPADEDGATIIALDAETGDMIETFHEPSDSVTVPMSLDSDQLVVCAGTELFALAASDLQRNWQHGVHDEITGAIPTRAGIVFNIKDGITRCVNRDTASIEWEYFHDDAGEIVGTPSMWGRHAFISVNHYDSHSDPMSVATIDVTTGEPPGGALGVPITPDSSWDSYDGEDVAPVSTPVVSPGHDEIWVYATSDEADYLFKSNSTSTGFNTRVSSRENDGHLYWPDDDPPLRPAMYYSHGDGWSSRDDFESRLTGNHGPVYSSFDTIPILAENGDTGEVMNELGTSVRVGAVGALTNPAPLGGVPRGDTGTAYVPVVPGETYDSMFAIVEDLDTDSIELWWQHPEDSVSFSDPHAAYIEHETVRFYPPEDDRGRADAVSSGDGTTGLFMATGVRTG